VVFLDLAKAFDTVSHKHINEGLKRFRVNRHFIDVVIDLYTDASTHFTLAKGETPKIPMTRGVKQGDPLSPLLRYLVPSAGAINGSFWPSTSHFGWKSLIIYEPWRQGKQLDWRDNRKHRGKT
jgi:hypothetical protein